MSRQEEVGFTTIDGLKLQGRLYLATGHGPAVILTPGV
jgi:hypothetical protein